MSRFGKKNGNQTIGKDEGVFFSDQEKSHFSSNLWEHNDETL